MQSIYGCVTIFARLIKGSQGAIKCIKVSRGFAVAATLSTCVGLPFALAQSGVASAEKDVKYLWRVLNGTNINPATERFAELLSVYKTKGANYTALAIVNGGDTSVVSTHVRTLFTPLAGRERNFSEETGDFVLSAMMATINDMSVDQMLLADFFQTVPVPGNYFDQSFRDTHLNGFKSLISQRYISDADYRLGLLTTQQYGESAFEGGTNRRIIKKIAENFLCKPIESLMNFSISDRWVGRDIPRTPGNDAKVYLNRCMGCHTGLDSLRGGFAGYDFNTDARRLVWMPQVQEKLNSNPNTTPEAYEVKDFSWEHLGWLPIAKDQVSNKLPPGSRIKKGPRAFVEMVVQSREYYDCLLSQVKSRLCSSRKPNNETWKVLVDRFTQHKKLKVAFADVASEICLK